MQRLTEEIPGDAWDVPLDGFASPDGLELFNAALTWRERHSS